MGNESAHKLFKNLNRKRLAKEKTLIGMTSGYGKKISLRFSFDALGDDTQVKTSGKRHDGSRDVGVVGVDQNVAHERPVNL
jgi:hypothetical protein